jgi:O-antigen/teichoic acid export membrane protein
MAHEEMIHPTVLGIIRRLMILFTGSTGIYLGWPPALTLVVYPASASLALIAAIMVFGHHYGWPAFQFNWRFIKTAMREGSPFLVVIILGRLYDRIGIIVLTALQSEAVAGIYTAGDRILATINGFSSIFAFALFPSVSRLAAEKNEQVEDLCNWALRMVFITLFPLASVLFVTSEQIIQLAFGEGFGDSAAMLQIICWSLVLSGFNRILAVLLIAYYKQGQLVRIRMAFYAGYCLLSMGLVWQFSYLGLAWAKIITEAGILLATFYCAVKICPAAATLKKFLLPTTLCLGPTIGLVLTGYSSWLVLGVFVVLFTVTGFYFAVIRSSDFQFLKFWLRKQLGPIESGDGSGLPR